MSSKHLFQKTILGAASDISSGVIFRRDWALDPFYLLWIHSLIWLEEFNEKFLKFWLKLYDTFCYDVICNFDNIAVKVESRPPKSFSKNNQYDIIFQMRCIPALFVDIFYGMGRLGQIGCVKFWLWALKLNFNSWWNLLKYLLSKQNKQKNVFGGHFTTEHT